MSAVVFPVFAVTVTIQKTDTTWQLLKDDQPYSVLGASGGAYPSKLVAAGGNSVRTYSPDKSTLDNAQSLGLTVCLGISGNDYNSALASVQAYKSHPALLMWGLGNEMESGLTESGQVALWQLVDSIARMVHQIDGQHPCITSLADIAGTKLQDIAQYATNAVQGKIATVNVYLDRETFMSLAAYSTSGKLVSVIDKGAFSCGQHAFAWQTGGLSGGTYFLRLFANGRTVTKKITLQ